MIARTTLSAVLAVAAMAGLATPAAADPRTSTNIRKLDIMLMVTSLRCRGGIDDFQDDYNRFALRHQALLNRAFLELRRDLVSRSSPGDARFLLDRDSTAMANDYGEGHPWLGCRELREVTRTLADYTDPAELPMAAEDLLSAVPREAVLAALGR